jgi:hypothetical protein
VTPTQYDTEYTLKEIDAFIEGPWVEDIKRMAASYKAHKSKLTEEREKKEREDPHKLEDLRKKFGI